MEEIDSGMTVGLEEEVISSLQKRFEKEPTFDFDLLCSVVKDVIEEVKEIREYPDYYTDSMVMNDLYKYKGRIQKIARYDYSKDGADGEISHVENGTSRSYVKRDELFYGIRSLSRVL